MSMIEFHDGGILAMLDKLPDEIHSKAIRPAAQAGAQVLYDEARRVHVGLVLELRT